MADVTYLVYESDTGNVIGLHVLSADLQESSDEVVRMADPTGQRRIEVRRVDRDGIPKRPSRLIEGTVHESEDVGGAGAAGTMRSSAEPEQTRTYELHPPEQAE